MLDWPAEIVAGFAVNEEITGGETMTVIFAVTEPLELVAVSVYVVVELGVTDLEVVPVTVPIPWSMDREVAPEVFHDNVLDCVG